MLTHLKWQPVLFTFLPLRLKSNYDIRRAATIEVLCGIVFLEISCLMLIMDQP